MTRFPRSFPKSACAALAALLLPALAVAQSNTRASVSSAGVEGNASSWAHLSALSADGRVVAFASDATNLVAGDTNGSQDVFVFDRNSGITERVSVDSTGAQMGTTSDGIYGVAISADGQVVAFASDASNLVAGDTNGLYDVFVHDRATGVTERVSIDSNGVEGDGDSFFPAALSADGNVVTFHGYATNFAAGDDNDQTDVFVHDRTTGVTERVSVDSSGAQADGYSTSRGISADGNVVAFDSEASNLVAGDANGTADVFVHDRTTGLTTRVSLDLAGAEGDDESFDASLSADGQLVAFASYATNLVAGDTNATADVFVHDRSTGLTARVSVDGAGAQVVGSSTHAALSADGKFVAYRSAAATLVAGDTNGTHDIFVHERATGLVVRASVDSAGVEADGASYQPSISANGKAVAYYSFATNLVAGDTNATYDVFVHDECADATWSNYGKGFAGANGVPAFTSQDDPVLGASVTLDLGSSANAASVAFVIFGFAETFVPTSKGGDLLVAPAFTLVLALPTAGTTIAGTLPDDEAACGFELFMQALELDPGAPKGVSFTAGLKLVCGR